MFPPLGVITEWFASDGVLLAFGPVTRSYRLSPRRHSCFRLSGRPWSALMPDPISLALFALLIGALAMWAMPERSCSQCAHCRQLAWAKKDAKRQRLERERQERRALHMSWHEREGTESCPWCEEHDAVRK